MMKKSRAYKRTMADWLGFFGFVGLFIGSQLIMDRLGWLCY